MDKTFFGKTENNEDIYIYILKNDFLEVEILNFGGIIKSIKFLKSENKNNNLVLSFNNSDDYIKNIAYFGTIVGRTAGRIKNAELKIDEKVFKLTKNSGENILHGGYDAISHRLWSVVEFNEHYIVLNIKDKDLCNGYPGNIDLNVKYSLIQNKLRIEYFCKTDHKTYVNFTNHSYFNLNYDKNATIYNHKLFINADYIVGIDKESLPIKKIKLDNNIFDFRTERLLADFFDVNKVNEQKSLANNGIDHPFILNSSFAASFMLGDIKIIVETDKKGLVVYTANYLKNLGLNNHSAICFETQDIPSLFKDEDLDIKYHFIDKDNDYYSYTDFIFNKI